MVAPTPREPRRHECSDSIFHEAGPHSLLGLEDLRLCSYVSSSRRHSPSQARTYSNLSIIPRQIRYIGIAQPFYSLALFSPSIIKALGYTNANANLLSVPPYALGFFTTLGIAWWSDKILQRGIFIISCMMVCIVGYIIQLTDVSAGAKYFGVFLCVGGVSPCISTCITWIGNKYESYSVCVLK